MLKATAFATLFLIWTGIAARAEEHIPCWKAKAFLAYHAGDRRAAERDAIARGYTRLQIADAKRRCE